MRLLTDATVQAATVVESEGTDCVIGQPLTIGLGFMLPPTLGPHTGPHAFGHPGAGGSLAFADLTVGSRLATS